MKKYLLVLVVAAGSLVTAGSISPSTKSFATAKVKVLAEPARIVDTVNVALKMV